jgi:uncharacterized protein (DUF302 family)|tara:strand:- start:6290 stop:6730 length:441 start_codon:yes stop_codon:yes gene_type:complete
MDETATAKEVLHTTVDMDFEDAVLAIQLEHELADFETINVSYLDKMIKGTLGETVSKVALIIVCHPQIAYGALKIDPEIAGMLPCTTVVYESPEDGLVHVHHVSATKAIRDLGLVSSDSKDSLDQLVKLTGEKMQVVWKNIKTYAK